jgi:hypothetical protein
MRTDTSLNIINDSLFELGMISTAFANPYTSTDANAIVSRYLLKALGQELVRKRPWSHLQKTHTFSTVNGTESYALPADFIGMVPSTEWNRTTGIRLSGPTGPRGWQVLKSSLNGAGTPDYMYRVYGNKLYLYETPTTAETIAFEYQSAYWVVPSGETTPTLEAPTAITDTLWFDKRLLVAGLKMRVLMQKGFDASAAQNDFEVAMAEASGNDGAHPVLSLTPGTRRRHADFPPTGWGA